METEVPGRPLAAPPEVRVLVVDDSASVRAVIRRFLKKTPDLVVIGEAADGALAVRAVEALSPDVIVMDLQMPVMDGFDAIERIMEVRPTPILVLSSRANRNQIQTAFEAIRRGALEVLPKPEDTASWQLLAETLPDAVREAANAQTVVARASSVHGAAAGRRGSPIASRITERLRPAVPTRPLRWVAIGASTGGPAAIRDLLEAIPPNPPVTFLIVQHIAMGFEEGFAEWLNREFPLDVRLARQGERPGLGAVRLAPAGAHLALGPDGVLHLDALRPPRRGHRPAVDELFLSCAEVAPRNTAGVLLTGMGTDGVEGLLALRSEGGLTVVQDEATSAVFGMPRVALERRAADLALPPREIAAWLAAAWMAPLAPPSLASSTESSG